MSYANHKIVKNSIFLKVEQGTPHTLRLLDPDPTEEWQHNINQKLVKCGGEMCSHCQGGHSKSQRFVANTYDHNEGKVVLWSYGPTVATTLKNLAISLEKDGENILDHDIEISVQGSGLQKKTGVQLRLKSALVPAGLKLHKIGASVPGDASIPGEDIPF